jgi:enamine deaminase RidA (YjgF/YER057c/UK114 family)
MTLSRQVIEPKNPALDQSQKFGLPLSPAVRGGDFVFLSGMAAIDPATGAPAHGTVAAETRQILTNTANCWKRLAPRSPKWSR